MKKKTNLIELLNISKTQFFTGIVLGVFYALIFYSFIYMIREGVRVFTIRDDYNLLVLSKEDVENANLFFAFISAIFGQSICFTFWFDKPNKVFQKQKIRKTRIIHEQRFLKWYFLHWFLKFGFLCMLVNYDLILEGSMVQLFPIDVEYIFALIIIVLFLQTWNTIRTSIKQKSLRFMVISAGVITLVSFSFSKINLINYKSFNDRILSNRIENVYSLVIPKSDAYKELKHRRLISDFYFVEDKVSKKLIILKDRKEITYKQMIEEIKGVMNSLSSFEIPYLTYQLYVHENIKMKYVNPLIREFSVHGSAIGFAVNPKKGISEIGVSSFRRLSFRKYYRQYMEEFDEVAFKKKLDDLDKVIKIKQKANGEYLVDNVLIKDDCSAITLLKNIIKKNPNYFIVYNMNTESTFSSYIKVLSVCRMAVLELRNEYSLNMFLTSYESLHRKEKTILKDKYPIRVYESFKNFD